ncbi:hypothetical protein E4U52_007668 [Claviceps spartinae]|nr:hypothetical protein E4U52_007668 [Claviceps spartinae]
MSNQEIRLRLAVRRHGVPEVKLVWPCERSADLTIAKLVASVNEVVPLECSEWGLEDYAVELVGADGDSYECLHFQLVAQILKDEDQLIIRPLLTDDVRRRRISGRYQISADGKHLFDGVPFGRPRLRAPRDRPAIELPARKRARIEAYEMEAGEPEPEEMLMLDAPPDHHDDDGDGDSDDDDWKPVQERHHRDIHDLEHAYSSISEHSDSDSGGPSHSREELDEELKALQDVELVNNETRPGTIECSSEYLDAISTAYPRVTLTAIEKELVKQKHNIRKTYDALQELTQPCMSFDEMMDGMVMGILDQSGSSPLQEQPVDVLLNRPSPPRRPLIEDVTNEGVAGSGSSEATSSDGDSTSDSGSDDEVEEDSNKTKDDNKKLSPHGEKGSSLKTFEDSSDDSSDDSFHDSGDESDSEAAKKDAVVASSSSSEVMSSEDESGSDSNSEDKVKEDSNMSKNKKGGDHKNKTKYGDKKLSIPGEKVSSSKISLEDSSDDSSDDSFQGSGDESDSEAVKSNDMVASSSSSEVVSSEDDSDSDSSSGDDVKKISTRGKGKDNTAKVKSGGKVSNLGKKNISSSDSDSDDDSDDSSDDSSCDSSDDSGPESVKNPSSTQTQQGSAPSQGLSRTQKRNARRRKQKVMMRQETSTPNSMDAELLARKEALLGALQAHVTHDASQKSPAKPESATNTPNGDRTAVAHASAETSAQRRTRVDMGAGRRMLFGALGLKNPKTKADEERIKQGLMKDVKPLSNPRIVEVNDGEHAKQATEEDADPDAWRSKVTYRAVECCHEGMKLSEPPFPFVQRWDPQQQYGSMRKRKRRADEFDEEYYGPSPSNGNKSNTRDPFRGQANGRVDTEPFPADTTNGQTATNGHVDQANNPEEEEEDLPPLPADLNALPSLKRGSAKKGMVITWKQCTMSKATQWQPVMASITGEVLVPDTLDPPNSVLQVWLAFRDREYKEKLYDEKTGQRIYDKFEVPDFEDEDGEEEEEDDGLRMVEWEEMGDPRILAEVSPWGRRGWGVK